tara:strand:+ start:6767 stop:9313 length:2547 start_codon:yes stop_codon:yes gene_type:complete
MKKNILIILLISINLFPNNLLSQDIKFFIPKNKNTVNNVEIKECEISKKTKNCILYEGLFNIYQDKDNGNCYIEIDSNHINNDFIYFSYIENGNASAMMMKGQFRGSKIINISKFYNKIEFTIKNTKYYFNDSSQLKKSENSNINIPIIVSEEILAINNEGNKFLINANNIFLNESLNQIKYPSRNKILGGLSKKTKYNKIRNYVENTDIVVEYIYDNKYPKSYGDASVTDSRSINIKYQHSLIKMPEDGFNPRFEDPRVGYFSTQSNDMTTVERINYRDVIHRWRLIKKDSSQKYSEPIEPIVYWIENTTPLEFRDIIKEAAESWNIAFKEAGFINAVQVKIQPDSADWEAGDIRYNVIRWTSSPRPWWGGYGPSFVNPLTGEILGADIMLEWTSITNRIYLDNIFNNRNNNENILIDTIFNQNNDHQYCNHHNESQIQNIIGNLYIQNNNLSNDMKKEMVRQSLFRLVLHEVGHTLGLTHNFKASTFLSIEELKNKDIVNSKGICSSVMEYPAINITNNPENQGLFYDIKPGPYDIWAIKYGYSHFNNNEREELDKILILSKNKENSYGNDADDMRSSGKGIDPNIMIYDLSDNPVLYAKERIELINNLIDEILVNHTIENESYEKLTRSYRTLLYSYFTCLNIMTRQIGGVNIDRSFYTENSENKPFNPVSEEKQKEALSYIMKYGFNEKYLINNNIYPYLKRQRRGFNTNYNGEDPKILEFILGRQSLLLSQLLNSNVLKRINNTSLYGNNYSISEYMIDLRNSIIQNDLNKNVSLFEQNLRTLYIKSLLQILNNKNYDEISKSCVYYNLNWIYNNINTSSGNLSSKQHKEYLKYIISDIYTKK